MGETLAHPLLGISSQTQLVLVLWTVEKAEHRLGGPGLETRRRTGGVGTVEVSGPLELNPVTCRPLTADAREVWRVDLAAQLCFGHLTPWFEGQRGKGRRGKDTAQGELSPSWKSVEKRREKGEALHRL